VNPTVYSVAEFGRKLRAGHYFVANVLNRPRIQLIGDGDFGTTHPHLI
jgi:hypothetical protein